MQIQLLQKEKEALLELDQMLQSADLDKGAYLLSANIPVCFVSAVCSL